MALLHSHGSRITVFILRIAFFLFFSWFTISGFILTIGFGGLFAIFNIFIPRWVKKLQRVKKDAVRTVLSGIIAGGIIGGDAAYKVAAMVKMAQNVLIGLAAFLMALWATMTLDRRESGITEKPSFMEIWYRFPKFVLGFVVASIVVSVIVEPTSGLAAVKTVGKATKVFRNWFFALCFVSIGLETNFKELVSVGGGRPAASRSPPGSGRGPGGGAVREWCASSGGSRSASRLRLPRPFDVGRPTSPGPRSPRRSRPGRRGLPG